MTSPHHGLDLSGMSTAQQAALVATLKREATRLTAVNTWPSGHHMSVGLDDSMKPTTMLSIIGKAMQDTVEKDRGRLLLSSPPQIGKSMTVAIWGALRALVGDPDLRVVVASYSESLAKRHVRAVRELVARHGSGAQDSLTRLPLPDRLGISLEQGKATEAEWQVAGRNGGMYAVGVGGSLSGKPADLLIVDDPTKGMAEADSEATKRRLLEWWQSVALARLSPTASVVLVQTRWTEDDLMGQLLEEGGWEYLNFPAQAQEGLADALGRAPGEYLETSRGHTPDTWQATEKAVGPRVWAALYQGNPTPAGGGLFLSDWFDRHRVMDTPRLQTRLVSIDPAETGRRDEAGLVAMGTDHQGRVVITHDRSGKMTSDQWARAAVILALQTHAQEVTFEAYTTEQTYYRVILNAWRQVEAELRLLRRFRGDVGQAATHLEATRMGQEGAATRMGQLVGLKPQDTDQPPFRLKGYRGKGDKVARAAGARQAASTGRMRIAGALPGLEDQAVTWQVGQASPDRVDAMVNGYNRLMDLRGESSLVSVPTGGVRRGNQGLASRMGRKLEF